MMNNEFFKKYVETTKPLITIITVVYNNALEIESTINSVIKFIGDRKDIEYIIVDGGSNDGTVEIIKKYHNQINKWISEKDNGIYDAMNKGVAIANGQWINFMNAGDIFENNTLELLIESLKIDSHDIVYGDVQINKNGALNYIKARPIKEIFYFLTFCHQSAFVRTKYLQEMPFVLAYKICSDHDFFLKCAIRGLNFKYLDFSVSIFLYGGISSGISTKYIYEKLLIINKNHTFLNKIHYTFKFLKTLIPLNRTTLRLNKKSVSLL